jgi:hypothetical protein
MSVTAVSPVSCLSATSLINKGEPQAQSYPQEDTEKAKAQISSDVSSSGSAAVAVQAFTAFQPDVQPIASLSPTSDGSQALPVSPGADLSGSTAQWSGGVVDVYA